METLLTSMSVFPIPTEICPLVRTPIAIVRVFSNIFLLSLAVVILLLGLALASTPFQLDIGLPQIATFSISGGLLFISIAAITVVLFRRNDILRKLAMLDAYLSGDLITGARIVAQVIQAESPSGVIQGSVERMLDNMEALVDVSNNTQEMIGNVVNEARGSASKLINSAGDLKESIINMDASKAQDFAEDLVDVNEHTALITGHLDKVFNVAEMIKNNPIFIFEAQVRRIMRILMIIAAVTPVIVSVISGAMWFIGLRVNAASFGGFGILFGGGGPLMTRYVRTKTIEKLERAGKALAIKKEEKKNGQGNVKDSLTDAGSEYFHPLNDNAVDGIFMALDSSMSRNTGGAVIEMTGDMSEVIGEVKCNISGSAVNAVGNSLDDLKNKTPSNEYDIA